jgi:hypothetical protein
LIISGQGTLSFTLGTFILPNDGGSAALNFSDAGYTVVFINNPIRNIFRDTRRVLRETGEKKLCDSL